MEIKLMRESYTSEATCGRMFIDGKYFCDTLEDAVRNLNVEAKIPGKTAIPAGSYRVIVNRSRRFKRELPLLLDVPYFTGIRIHRGNTVTDTSGCILVGEKKGQGMVVNSTPYETHLTDLCKAALVRGEKILLVIK